MGDMTVWQRWLDSYRHYRRHVGLAVLGAVYRACYYELRHKEPYA